MVLLSGPLWLVCDCSMMMPASNPSRCRILELRAQHWLERSVSFKVYFRRLDGGE
jgi:hypothetical protein